MNKILSIIFLLCAMTIAAGTGHPITVDDLFALQRIGSPAISPEGNLVAFTVDTYSMESNSHQVDLWLLDVEQSTTRRLTFDEANDATPRWAPDGKKLYFLSARGDRVGVYSLPLDGGEAGAVTDLCLDVDDFYFSPDGLALYLLVSLYPECGDDWECNAKQEEIDSSAESKAKIFDNLFYRHWNHWLDRTISHVVRYELSTGDTIDLTPGDDPVPPISLNGDYSVAFSPDGGFLAYVVHYAEKTAVSTNHDIVLKNLKDGSQKSLTAANMAWDDSPLFSPDGKYLAYLKMSHPGYEADQNELVLKNRKSGERKILTERFDLSVGKYIFSPDSKTIYFIAGNRGYSDLFSVPAKGGEINQLTEKRTLSDLAIFPDGKRILLAVESSKMPRELHVLDVDTHKLTRRTFLNEEHLKRIKWGEVEEVNYSSSDGTAIHGFLVKPPEFDPEKRYPLLVLIHGGPQGAWEDDFHYRWNLQMFAAPGYVVFAPNFRGSTGYGAAFKEAISGDWGGKPYEDIMSGVDYVLGSRPFVDGKRMVAAGASYGGFMVNWIATKNDRFSCLVSHDGVYDQLSMYGTTEELWFPEWEFKGDPFHHPELYAKFSPSLYVKNVKTPVMIVQGANDFRVPLNQAMHFFTALQRLGVKSRFLYFPDEDHFVRKPKNARVWWKEVFDWFAECQ